MQGKNHQVKKIAIVNPYLLRGLHESSEMEGIMRFIAAARNLNIEAAVFNKSEEIYDFNPDFVIPISHQEPKLTHYPTYGLFNNPIQWVTSSQRFARNTFTYDGYMGVVPGAIQWLKNVCAATGKKLHLADAVFTVPKTDFIPIDLRKATAAYLGVNWDGLRHFDLFSYFQDGNDLKCYGPKESWIKYPAKLYGGMIPFDGVTALKVYANHGIGLCISHPAMDNEGFPTSRTFEIPASSAIAICSKNNYTELKFRDTVLYVDQHLNTKELAANIKEKIIWVREHAKEAQEMARAAHDIFNKELSLERFIQNIVNMHYEVIQQGGFVSEPAGNNSNQAVMPKLTYIISTKSGKNLSRIINDIKNQTYTNINIIILYDKNNFSEEKLRPYLNSTVFAIPYAGPESNEQVYRNMLESRTLWLGFINEDDRLFNNHTLSLMQCYNNSMHNKSRETLAIIFSNSLDHCDDKEIKDKMQDYFMMYLGNKSQIGNITPCNDIPLCAVLFKVSETLLTAFSTSHFTSGVKLDISTSEEPLEVALHNNSITCSAAVSDNPSIMKIHNASSPLNFPANSHEVEGKLLIDERQKQKAVLENDIENKHVPAQPVNNTLQKQGPKPTEKLSIVNNNELKNSNDYQSTLDRVFYQPTKVIANAKSHQYAVAIILRTKDRPICIPRAMKSILSQTFKDWQLVIVNDGGNNEILNNILQPIKSTLGERLVVIHHTTSLGMSRGLNVGIDATDSEFIVVHDDDDSWQPEFLMETVNFLKDANNVDCCGVVTHSIRIREEITDNQIIEQHRDDFNSTMNPFTRLSMYRILMQNTFPPISFLFKRNIIDKIGYFNEDLPVLNDWDFNIRCLFQEEIGVLPKHLANYHMRTNQQDTIYGNSIIATSNLCLQLETVIRNRSLRKMLTNGDHNDLLGLCMAMGGEELPQTRTPLKLDIALNALQQIPNWLQQVQTPLKNDIQVVYKELAQINNKLEALIRQKVGDKTPG